MKSQNRKKSARTFQEMQKEMLIEQQDYSSEENI